MSGSGGGGEWPGGGGEATEDCNIVERTPLNSPHGDVIKGLSIGAQLQLSLVGDGKKRSVVALTEGGKVAGAITSRSLAQLVRCIEAGNQYVAHVRRVSGGLCEVEIRRAP